MLAVFVLLGFGFFAEVPTSSAHAVLVASSPAANQTIATAPDEIRLEFDEPVTPVVVRVLDSEGRSVIGPDAVSVRDTVVRIRLPDSLRAGSYIVSYRVISADSHPVGGSYVFAIGDAIAAPTAEAAGALSDSAVWRVIAVALRGIFYAALLIGVGGALFRLAVDHGSTGPPSEKREIGTACALAAVVLAIQVGVEGGMAAAAPVAGILDPAIWMIGIRSTLGVSALITIAGLACVVIAIAADRPWLSPALIAGGAVIAASGFAATGHVATAAPRWLTAPALVLHVLGAAYWIGALLPLYRRLDAGDEVAAAVVTRFSRVAVAGVAVLVGAGLIIACVQVRAPAAVVDTAYGQRLIAKLVLVAGLLLLASLNKWRLTPRLLRGDPRAAAVLRMTIVAEFALAGGIVVATAMLGQVPPPRVLATMREQQATHGFAVTVQSGTRRAVLDVTPARPGANRFSVKLASSDGAPITALGVTVRLANPSLGIEASEHVAVAAEPGHYAVTVPLPIAGTWTCEIRVLVTDFEEAVFSTTVPIR